MGDIYSISLVYFVRVIGSICINEKKIINFNIYIYNKFLYSALIVIFLLIAYFKLGDFISFWFLPLFLLSFIPTIDEIIYKNTGKYRCINRIKIYKGTKF